MTALAARIPRCRRACRGSTLKGPGLRFSGTVIAALIIPGPAAGQWHSAAAVQVSLRCLGTMATGMNRGFSAAPLRSGRGQMQPCSCRCFRPARPGGNCRAERPPDYREIARGLGPPADGTSDAGWLRGQTTRRRIHRRSDGGPKHRHGAPAGDQSTEIHVTPNLPVVRQDRITRQSRHAVGLSPCLTGALFYDVFLGLRRSQALRGARPLPPGTCHDSVLRPARRARITPDRAAAGAVKRSGSSARKAGSRDWRRAPGRRWRIRRRSTE